MTENADLVRQLLALLSAGDSGPSLPPGAVDPKVGAYVIVRCRDAGVHAGILVRRNGRDVSLRHSRRLWSWRVPMGKPAFLSGVAEYGLGEDCKLGCPVAIDLLEACEVITCSADARRSIEEYPTHERSK